MSGISSSDSSVSTVIGQSCILSAVNRDKHDIWNKLGSKNSKKFTEKIGHSVYVFSFVNEQKIMIIY